MDSAMKGISKYLAEIGAKGGATTGKSKKRGGSDYYRKLALKSVRAKKRKREEK